jgi:hypothetical protein
VQRRFFFGITKGQRTARMASSNTVLSPFCVKAEHSKYFTELISFAIAKPLKARRKCQQLRHRLESIELTCGYVIGCNFLSRNLSIVFLSSRKSNFVPTNMMGVDGQW